MILNKFLDKTLEAAKQSALQIAGDDYSQIRNVMPDHEDGSDGQSGSSNDPKKEHTKQSSEKKSASAKNKDRQGVVFERSSTRSEKSDDENKDSNLNKRLESIRKYAAQQSGEQEDTVDRKDSQVDAQPKGQEKQDTRQSSTSENQLYSRKAIRKQNAAKSKTQSAGNSSQSFEDLELNNMDPTPENEQAPLYDKFVPELPNGVSRAAKEEETEQQKSEDSSDLHKRLDRLESLMHLALSAPDADFAEHPLFHRLVQKGVSKNLVRRWFEQLIEQGIQPKQQIDLFSSKLLQLIDELLQQSKADVPQKNMLFTGRSGAGKTQLIMKLITLPNFLSDKKVAVVSFNPNKGDLKANYSLLEPFCKDHDINYYSLHEAAEIDSYQKEWDAFDHILFDTPALDLGERPLIEAINNLKEQLNKFWACETHYLVNTAVNGTAFNDPLAQDIDADHLALTHIDQSLKWGQAVQLLKNTDYKLRYISSGPSINGDLLPFMPLKFARKLLRA